MSDGIKNRIGPFHYADGALRRRKVGETEYLIGIAGAYNAFGLIGPEHNGIFVLDDTNKSVVLDRDTEEQSGYFGPSKRQWSRLEYYCKCSVSQFLDLIYDSPRSRLAA
tara:strand:- start:1559 stop:1885 length:327 start_codon:yes stop_codon:yes gene_type:complete